LRATRAYITSVGATGLLIASAFATLFVMSAFVAFNGFPGQDVQDPIKTLLVNLQQTPVSVKADPVPVSTLRARHGVAAAHAHARTRTHSRARQRSPMAHSSPVTRRGGITPPSAQTPASSPQPGALPTPAGEVTPPLPAGGTPSVGTPSVGTPSVGMPSPSKVELPPVQLPSPPNNTQLPVDTSGVTGLLGG
jgi:hypothetical protein